MVVKTEVCNFSDLRIYPGHGSRLISRDGKIHVFIHKKARCMFVRKIKAQEILWTTAWRRLNKKIKNTDNQKKKRRKAKRVVREITGMTADEINRRKNESTGDRDARKNEAIRQIKQRKATNAKANPGKANMTKQTNKPQKGGKAAKR